MPIPNAVWNVATILSPLPKLRPATDIQPLDSGKRSCSASASIGR